MVKKSPVSLFPGKQGHLYAVLLLVWQNYEAQQKDFSKKNTKYTVQLGKDQQQAVKDARDMPDITVRRELPKEAREAMAVAAKDCTDNWQDLSGLIENSFPESEWETRKGQAGYGNYAAATNQQWDAVISLNNAAQNFITENNEALTLGGMLPSFPGEFTVAKDKYDSLYDGFYGAKQSFSTQSTAKANANNAIYKTAMSMMDDGKKMFRKDASLRALFTYASLMKTVRGEGFTKTGYRFIIQMEETLAPVTTATILLDSATFNKTFTASEKGIIRCDAPAGTYNFTLTAPGFTTLIGTVKIQSGTMRQKKIKVKKAAGKSEVA